MSDSPSRPVAALGPHCVGLRVVVRRVLPGEIGPSGGPAMTDVLGEMTSWGPTATTVLPEGGEPVTIPLADIVAGKPVPPRPSVRLRVSAEEAERRALAGWPAVTVLPLGAWVLRASGGFSSRANSVLAVGSPERVFSAAVDDVLAFYAERGLPPWAQVVVGSDPHLAFEEAGWVPARPGEADTEFQIASVAQVSRHLRGLPAGVQTPVAVSATLSDGWLADDSRAQRFGDAARAVLEGPDDVAFVSVGAPGEPLRAKGRVSISDDWAGITDVWVSPEHRRRGLAIVVMRELVGWAAERGATTAYLQARGDNAGALTLWERLGFGTHHRYRYLTMS